YVLRRLLRRAVTRGRSKQGLALHGTFLADVAARAIAQFGGHYRELETHRDRILKLLEQEEAGFGQTYEQGMERLERLLAHGATTIPGSEAFALHDTFGFPIELTQEIASARGVEVDIAGFEREMEQQRSRARAASRFEKSGGGEKRPWTRLNEGADSVFTGYDTTAAENVRVMAWREAGEELELL